MADQLGMRHLAQPIAGLSGQRMAEALEAARDPVTRESVARSVEALRGSGATLRELILQAVR
jgi:hypothetical protein